MSFADKSFRAGFCAIVGRPNVGKSTLLNRMLGEKLAVVTSKPQTTRNRIMGIKNRRDAQIILVDTPGIHAGRSSLNRYMVEQALSALKECDVVVFMIEATRAPAGEGNRLIVEKLAEIRNPRILAINKVDLLADKTALLPLIEEYSRLLPFVGIVPIAAASGDGVGALEDEVVKHLPVGEKLYPDDMLTDRAERFLAAELIREQVFLRLAKEVPYSIAVTVEGWQERKDKGDVVIDANVNVERESQKRIVIGEGGRMLRDIGTEARKELGKLLGCPVHLKLFVKVMSDWTRTKSTLRRLGYE